MTDKDTIKFDSGTGEGEIPAYALEETQKKVLLALKKGFKLSTAELDIARRSLDEQREQTDAIEEGNQAQRDLIDILNRQNKSGLTDMLYGGASALGKLVGATAMVTGGLISFAGFLAQRAASMTLGVGDELNKLNPIGIGFQKGLIDATVGLNQFGLSTAEVVSMLADSATATSLMTAKGLAATSKEFQGLTQSGKSLGLSLRESTEYMAEELETRASLGLLNKLSDEAQARASQTILETQLNAAKILGKSIKEINQQVKNLFTSNVNVNTMLNRLGNEGRIAVQNMFSTLSGANVDDTIQNALADILGSVSGVDESGLFTAIQVAAAGGEDVANTFMELREQYRAAILANDGAELERLGPAMQESIFNVIRAFTEQGSKLHDIGNVMAGESAIIATIINSGRLVNEAQEKLAKIARDRANLEKGDYSSLSTVQLASLSFESIMDQLTGTFNALETITASMVSGPLLALSNSLQAVGEDGLTPLQKISSKIIGSFSKITNVIKKLMGYTEDNGEAMLDLTGVVDTLGTWIDDATNSIIEFIESIDKADGKNFMEKLSNKTGDLLKNFWENTVFPAIMRGINQIGETIKEALIDLLTNPYVIGALTAGAGVMIGSLGSQFTQLGTAMDALGGEGGALTRLGGRLGTAGLLVSTFAAAFTATTAILDAFNIKNKIGTALYDAVDAIQGVWGGDDQSRLENLSREESQKHFEQTMEKTGNKISESMLQFYKNAGVEINPEITIETVDPVEFKEALAKSENRELQLTGADELGNRIEKSTAALAETEKQLAEARQNPQHLPPKKLAEIVRQKQKQIDQLKANISDMQKERNFVIENPDIAVTVETPPDKLNKDNNTATAQPQQPVQEEVKEPKPVQPQQPVQEEIKAATPAVEDNKAKAEEEKRKNEENLAKTAELQKAQAATPSDSKLLEEIAMNTRQQLATLDSIARNTNRGATATQDIANNAA